ncbi:Gfo/Idh/MocA family protein [Nostocoides sp. HKS02]|uniref:Gfo/Idh/MocA family protein n=1 Tax=Nostocoides sp. HKS02 TaxID=1813880 RepID=UPI0012B4E4AF|nr:Gfo/Idh/MocA family oxidoreductase [Tetrasphaera sp. HKS02]QGN57251.1 gfo/Idh/MocA family oxidoreductase [Tetrasphaera sp. HKS02]
MTTLGMGVVGAGRFAHFVADATADLPGVEVRAVADPVVERAQELAHRHGARPVPDWRDLLDAPDVEVVVVATPPATHARIVTAALEAGRHVFCEKPLATEEAEAHELVDLVERSGRVLVVDHVLRYNPILRALRTLQPLLLGQVQSFSFDNDASDEDLDPGHWFWDTTASGGIFVEHGVHFFDAAAMLIGQPATAVQATAARRSDGGPVDLVSATVRHGERVLATHTHSFTHAHRCERQHLRLDHGAAEVRVDGWIPIDAAIDAWTDEDGARFVEHLPSRVAEVMQVDGYRLDTQARITARVHRDAAGSPYARGRGLPLDIPHHVRVQLTLGGPSAKAKVYAESVRAAMADLVSAVTTGTTPYSSVREGAAAVAVAAAATQASHDGRSVAIPDHLRSTSTPMRTA